MTQQTAPIAAGELRATLSALADRGERPTGLVMSPETWALFTADGACGEALYDGVPVWLQLDRDGVELLHAASRPPAADEAHWI